MSNIQNTTVIIIGAGIAGIKAATTLHQAGIKTLILEARDRIGGRILTYQPKNSKYKYDLGACWFHSTSSNPVFAKSVELGQIDYVFDDKPVLFVGPDGALSDEEVGSLGPVVGQIKSFASAKKQVDDVSLKQAVAEYLFANDKSLSDQQKKYAPSLVRFLEIPNGCSWEGVSARLADPGAGNGRDAFVKSGYSDVLKQELDGSKYPVEENILTGKVVTKVKTLEDGSIEVFTDDNSIYKSEFAIVTIPQAVLKISGSDDETISKEKGAIKFEPSLPTKILDGFKKTHMTSLSKVIFEFDKSFWPDVEKFIIVPKPDESLKLLSTKTTKPNFKTQEHNKPPESNAKLDPFDYPYLIANLQSLRNIPALMVLAPAPATQLLETKGGEFAWNFLKPIIANLSNLKIDELPKEGPKVTVTTNWTNDAFSRGSISGNAPGDNLVNDGLIDGVGNLRFAGEAYCYEGHGNAHGAYLSGLKEAEFIAGKLGHKL
ncbi:unnamed protein product [Ambrosiozyma monospora]|uniref:Unnamed protein product n=1 Tax=Ambrosiozyma monospora TaxID=43982 RepID=A0A9W6YSK5_AMBMO|nr:unnamed protein product [Ambrosiozyma monospora]